MPPQMPKWMYLLVALVAIAAVAAIVASVRTLRNASKARALIDAGTVQISISDADRAYIASELRKAAAG